jgi:hypothetical protein
MSTQTIEITPNPTPTPGQPAVFVPSAAVTYAYDSIQWHNGDTNAHWPAPSASPADQKEWFDYQIVPGATSPASLSPQATATAYVLNYVCSLHPDETGQITVNPQQ